MVSSLPPRRFAGAYNPDVLAAVGMSDNQKPTGIRHSHSDEALFRDGMIGVVIRHCQRIAKDGGRLVE
jgi:hypothetical protein